MSAFGPFKPIIAISSTVDQSDVSDKRLVKVVAALQTQVSRDFAPIWSIDAEVIPIVGDLRAPLSAWTLRMNAHGDSPGEHGYTEGSPPKGFVTYADNWTRRLSHELLEMLGNPFMSRYHLLPSLRDPDSKVLYPQEVVDPCQSIEAQYQIGDVLVSDFVTPAYYDFESEPVEGTRYSFRGRLKHPRDILEGAGLDWREPSTFDLWEATRTGGLIQFTQKK